MRSRLWALIVRELPFPFRELGIELVRTITWIDKTFARIWLGFVRSPAWYVVTVMGTLAFVLTGLLFFTFVSSHDPTLRELANGGKQLAPVTREHLEEAGDWAAQDKWRLAHMFVDHRPPRRQPVRQIDSRLVDDFPAFARVPSRRELQRRSGFNSRFEAPERSVATASVTLPDPEVRLDLGTPRTAEQPKRLVFGPYVRDTSTDIRPVRLASNYRSRDSRLLVQAEWAFASDCDHEPARRPTRRIIPVPDPQWDELPPIPQVTDDRHPDLSFQMSMLREFLPVTGEFPPKSRTATVSAYSEFPPSPSEGKGSNPFAFDLSPWNRTSHERAQPDRPIESYVDRVGVEDEPLSAIDDIELRPGTTPSFADVSLRMEVQAPVSVTAGQLSQSALVLRNEGLRDVPVLTVRESLAGLETVIDAIPPARVDQFENTLERRVDRLEPGKDQRLELVWRPDTEGIRTYSAIVTVQAAVGATTEIVPPVGQQPMPSVAPEPIPAREPDVEPEPVFEQEPAPPEPQPPPKQPALSFEVQNQPRAIVDDLVEFAIVVRNTGDLPLHDVRVVAHLPEQLKHRQGTEVEYNIPQLPVRGTERAVLRVVAQSSGQAICRLHVSAEEPAEAKSKAVVEVAARPVRPEPQKITRDEPKPPISVPKRPMPAPAVAPLNCCCQSQPFAIVEPWDLP